MVQIVLLVLAVIEALFVILVARAAHPDWPPMRIAGICVSLMVLAWVGIARFQLGRSFSIAPQARKLVTHGLYARFRNPIYLASPVLLIGLSMAVMHWWPLLLSIVIVPVQVIRARREAAVLRARFGEEYERYRARTWF